MYAVDGVLVHASAPCISKPANLQTVQSLRMMQFRAQCLCTCLQGTTTTSASATELLLQLLGAFLCHLLQPVASLPALPRYGLHVMVTGQETVVRWWVCRSCCEPGYPYPTCLFLSQWHLSSVFAADSAADVGLRLFPGHPGSDSGQQDCTLPVWDFQDRPHSALAQQRRHLDSCRLSALPRAPGRCIALQWLRSQMQPDDGCHTADGSEIGTTTTTLSFGSSCLLQT